jgi:4-amino-4-deoxy-L-arabinose transferase-like glycosyltransferase
MALALFVNAWGLSKTGYGNTYYAAATRSMTDSWHNFFFVSLDPGGFISVDKPPVFLWVDGISARIFGYSSLSLLMPSAIAGTMSVGLLWLIMRRYFGVLAATIAGLVLALTPISVAVDRLNLPEPFLLLSLIAAAGCALRSLESKRWLWWTIAAGLLVGVAFNTKMLVGWIPGPAIVIAILVGMHGDWWKQYREWIPRLAVFGVVALVASASWMLVVDAWPSASRPYVGGSADNSVYNLAVGYNGIGREQGTNSLGNGGRPPISFAGAQPNGGRPQNGNGRGAPNARGPFAGGNPNGAGGIIAGQPGPLRMFDDANGGQIAWFLPFAIIGGVLCLWRWRGDNLLRANVILWGGWALTFGIVFSNTQGIYHSYYTSALAPGVAAVVGMSCVALPDLIRRHKAWLIAAILAAAATVYVQLVISHRTVDFYEWVTPFMVATVVIGLVVLVAATWTKRLPIAAGMAVVVAGLLLIPGAWSGYEAANASSNTTLPQAGPRNGGAASRSFGSLAFDTGTSRLAQWLTQQSSTGEKWDLAVSSAQNASTLIAEYNLSVMSIGGFSGSDPTITAAQFGDYVTKGDIRYVLISNGFGGRILRNVPGLSSNAPPLGNFTGARDGTTNEEPKGSNAVMSAVESTCERVQDRTLPVQYQGSLYDCAGMGSALTSGTSSSR